MQDAKEEVRSRLNIEDVIGEYVQLKRAGRSFRGLSPFSSEKTPSFYVSPDKNIWHDFSSNKGGDVFSFVMEVEGMDFRQALELLAQKAGVDLTKFQSAGSQKLAEAKKRSLEANRLASIYFQKSLVSNQHALEYCFGKRGLSKQVVADFMIGYAPTTGDALKKFLTRRGFSNAELTAAGLLNRFGGDLFRGRMMIALMNATGQVIGFTGRIIDDDPKAPKYLNTPETTLYDKSNHIFGLSQAKEAIRQAGRVVIVEGNLDVVSSHQAGVKNVVATAGTAMTEKHLGALKRLSADVRLAYDGDKAGIAASERAIGMAGQLGIDLSVISLPEGFKDPDELIKSSAEAWQQAIDTALPAIEWVLRQYTSRLDLGSAKGKQQFIDKAFDLLDKVESRAEVRHYGEFIAEQTGFSYQEVLNMVGRDDVEQTIVMNEDKAEQPAAAENFAEMEFRYEDDALAVASIDGPSQELFAQLDSGMLHGEERQALARYFAHYHGKKLTETPKQLQKFDTYVRIVVLRADTRYADWSSDECYYETARLIRQIEHEHKKQTRAELTNQLRNAERAGDEAAASKLRVELNNLIKEIARGGR